MGDMDTSRRAGLNLGHPPTKQILDVLRAIMRPLKPAGSASQPVVVPPPPCATGPPITVPPARKPVSKRNAAKAKSTAMMQYTAVSTMSPPLPDRGGMAELSTPESSGETSVGEYETYPWHHTKGVGSLGIRGTAQREKRSLSPSWTNNQTLSTSWRCSAQRPLCEKPVLKKIRLSYRRTRCETSARQELMRRMGKDRAVKLPG